MIRKRNLKAPLFSPEKTKKIYRINRYSVKTKDVDFQPENYEKEIAELIESMKKIKNLYYMQNLQIDRIQKLSLLSIIRSKFQEHYIKKKIYDESEEHTDG